MASLRDLGLSEYESRAYRSLLRTGPTTAKELSRASDVPMGRIYDVLNALEQLSLVRSQTASRPKKYVAVEPETALDRLLEDKKRELAEQVEQYEELVEELVVELDAAEPVQEQFWTAAVGLDESVDLLLERIAAADDRVVMVTGPASAGSDLGDIGTQITEALERAVERGVSVSVLMSPELVASIPERVDDAYTRALADDDRFEIRISPDVSGTFTLIDDTEVCIDVPNPLDAEQPFALIDLKDPEFAADVRAVFDPRWDEADQLPE